MLFKKLGFIMLTMKTLSILGDSLSTYEGYIPEENETYYPTSDVDDARKTWWSIVLEKTGFTLGTLQAYSGSRVTVSGIRPAWSCMLSEKRLSTVSGDVILILGGINDCCQETDVPSLETFRLSYDLLIKEIKKRNPEGVIVAMTTWPFPMWKPDVKNSKGWCQNDLTEAITRIAEDNEVLLCPLHLLNTENDESLFIEGTVHPSAKGMAFVGNAVTDFLAERGIMAETFTGKIATR